MSFDSLGLLPQILETIAEKGYKTPSPIQLQAIPPVLEGRDVMAAAQTGTGKTAGFTLPILQRLSSREPSKEPGREPNSKKVKPNQVRALILTPTRELAAQVADSVNTYGKNLPLSSVVVFGGVKINPQMMKLRKGADILVATPGRLIDLFNQNAVKFDQLEILVLDEADRMLDMGFINDIKKIIRALPKKRQNLMFSATFSNDIRSLAKSMVNNPVEVSVSPPNTTVDLVEQKIYPVDKSQKTKLLTALISDNQWTQVLVFSRTKHGANRLSKVLDSQGIQAAAIHGNKSQGARTRALAEFKQGKIQVLVATDIAARGLDIDQLPYVVNFDLPSVPEDYVHRIGRTGRAGASGHAVSLVSADEFPLLSDIERLIQQIIPRELLEGFAPVHALPESRLDRRAPRQSKPKRSSKPRRGHQDGQRSAENSRGHKPTGKNKRHTAGSRANSESGNTSNNQSGNKKSAAPKRKPSGNSTGNSVRNSEGKSGNFWGNRAR